MRRVISSNFLLARKIHLSTKGSKGMANEARQTFKAEAQQAFCPEEIRSGKAWS
jgi:hypothetical protein